MKLRLLAYAVGLLLAVGLALVAAHFAWSDQMSLIAGLVVGTVWTVFVLVPVLIRQQRQ